MLLVVPQYSWEATLSMCHWSCALRGRKGSLREEGEKGARGAETREEGVDPGSAPRSDP